MNAAQLRSLESIEADTAYLGRLLGRLLARDVRLLDDAPMSDDLQQAQLALLRLYERARVLQELMLKAEERG